MNTEGFNALYDRHSGDLLRYLIRRAQNSEEAADCLAETFLVVWRKRDEMPSDDAQARPWLFGVARNVLRRERELDQHRSQTVAALSTELLHTRRAIPADDPGTAALRLLSPVDREIIEMLAWDLLSPREVATILDLSPNVVRIRAHRARLRMRKHLQAIAPDLTRQTHS